MSRGGDQVLTSKAFTFADQEKQVSVSFGCSALTDGNILGAFDIMGLSLVVLSMVSLLAIPKFSYCLMRYADHKSSPVFFCAIMDLQRYKTT